MYIYKVDNFYSKSIKKGPQRNCGLETLPTFSEKQISSTRFSSPLKQVVIKYHLHMNENTHNMCPAVQICTRN